MLVLSGFYSSDVALLCFVSGWFDYIVLCIELAAGWGCFDCGWASDYPHTVGTVNATKGLSNRSTVNRYLNIACMCNIHCILSDHLYTTYVYCHMVPLSHHQYTTHCWQIRSGGILNPSPDPWAGSCTCSPTSRPFWNVVSRTDIENDKVRSRGTFFAWRTPFLSWPRIMCSQMRMLKFLEPSQEMP